MSSSSTAAAAAAPTAQSPSQPNTPQTLVWFPDPAKGKSYKVETSDVCAAYDARYSEWFNPNLSIGNIESSWLSIADKIATLAEEWVQKTPARVNREAYYKMLDTYNGWHDVLHVQIPALVRLHEETITHRTPQIITQPVADFLARLDEKSATALINAAQEAFVADINLLKKQKTELENLAGKVTTALRSLKESLKLHVTVQEPDVSTPVSGFRGLASMFTSPTDPLRSVEKATLDRRAKVAAEAAAKARDAQGAAEAAAGAGGAQVAARPGETEHKAQV